MDQLILIRQNIIGFYKKFETIINYILKFLVGWFIFSRINTIGLYREEFEILFVSGTQTAYLALVSLLFTISPPSVALFLVVIAITIQLSAALEVAIFVFLLLVLVIVFYVRLAPRRSMLIVAMIFGFFFNLPYAVVLFGGLYFGIASIIPIILGTAVWYFLPFFAELAQNPLAATEYGLLDTPVGVMAEFDLFELPIGLMEVFSQIYGQLTTNFNWVILGFVFAMMVLAVHLISLISINYSKDIAIGAGGIIGIICMIIVVSVTEVDMAIGGIFLSSIGSVLLVWLAKFFDNVVDYTRVERVHFDDEDNVYYVKIIPKVKADIMPARPKPKRPAPAKRRRPARPAPGAAARPGAYGYGARKPAPHTHDLDDDEY